MDSSSAVSPTVREQGNTLFLSYSLPSCESSAVVSFDGVVSWFYGGPSDERLMQHPLWGKGLDFYEFHNMLAAPDDNLSGWLATFHDGTFEVVAASARVLRALVVNASPEMALDLVLGQGKNSCLDGAA
jgi:hypothetical protein